MAKVIRVFLLLVLACGSLVPLAGAETGTVVNDLWQLSQEHGQKFHDRINVFEQAGLAGQRRIERALHQVRSAKSANAKTYYRLDYVEQRAVHIKTMAREVIGLMKDNDRYVKATSQAWKNHQLFIDSDQLNGMRTLLSLVMNEERERPVKSKNLVEDASSRILTLALTHLVTPPAVMTQEQAKQVAAYRKGLSYCLEGFRKEIDYLDRQMQTI